MPKSRQAKRLKKAKNRRLIMEYWTDKPIRQFCRHLYPRSLQWIAKVISETPSGAVDEYTFVPDKEMFLNEFLGFINDELINIIEDDAVNCGIRVYVKTK
ncbi:hypothetical protein [Zhongshania aquimaris]|uniref:DUF721 domain-containing protein n=1 Tax=Zhongshania aquimaris TaxID=2857107 RepID=A0ABS6VVW9_9GAMM|nr:hypothetical protein [Zhongshania aquimaris]MBW2942164.1 hypothetical protein [Zhongshania aquimaris]